MSFSAHSSKKTSFMASRTALPPYWRPRLSRLPMTRTTSQTCPVLTRRMNPTGTSCTSQTMKNRPPWLNRWVRVGSWTRPMACSMNRETWRESLRWRVTHSSSSQSISVSASDRVISGHSETKGGFIFTPTGRLADQVFKRAYRTCSLRLQRDEAVLQKAALNDLMDLRRGLGRQNVHQGQPRMGALRQACCPRGGMEGMPGEVRRDEDRSERGRHVGAPHGTPSQKPLSRFSGRARDTTRPHEGHASRRALKPA